MKKFAFILIIALAFFCPQLVINTWQASADNNSSSNTNFMIFPTALEVTAGAQTLFVFDAADQTIKAIENDEIVAASPVVLEVVKLLWIEEESILLAFSREDNTASPISASFDNAFPLTAFTYQTGQFTSLTNNYDSTVFAYVQDISGYFDGSNFKLLAQLNVGNPVQVVEITLSFEAAELKATRSSFINSSDSSSITNIESIIETAHLIEVFKDGANLFIYLANQTGIYVVDVNMGVCREIIIYNNDPSDVNEDEIAVNISVTHASDSKTYISYVNKNNDVFIAEAQESAIATLLLKPTGNPFVDMVSDGDYLYFASPEDPAIYSFLIKTTGGFSIFFQNNFTHPDEILEGSSVRFLKTTTNTLLLEFPYSVTGLTIEKDTIVCLVFSSNGVDSFSSTHHYVLYFDALSRTNKLGYIKTEDTVETYASPLNITLKANVQSANITKYPSIIIDTINTVTAQVSQGDQFTAISNAAEIEADGIRFYIVRLSSGEVGYIPRSLCTSVSPASSPRSSTNATVIRDTFLYSDAEGTIEVMGVAKNTRVKVQGKINPKSDYTLVSFINNSGQTISGYIETSALVGDGLSTLQIVGIILLCANVIILIIILIFWLKYRKKPI